MTGGGNKPSQDDQEAMINKALKEKSSALIGNSIVQLTKICMPKCINMRDPQVSHHE